MIITFGLVAIFCIAVIVVLQRAHVTDKSFTDYAVADRSFGPAYQMMSFLNTWWPGSNLSRVDRPGRQWWCSRLLHADLQPADCCADVRDGGAGLGSGASCSTSRPSLT